MLVLSRKVHQVIEIGDSIRVIVLRIGADTVRLGIEAPRDCAVHRQEIADAIRAQPKETS